MHSSSTITMSAPSAISISSAFSGERKCSEPSRCERNVTPSSVTLRNSLRLKTWNPPESVRIARGHAMNLCSPPIWRINSCPGRRYKWYVFESRICTPRFSRSCCVWPFTVAAVPTGMNAGVSITPCGVVSRPRRAPVGSVASTSNLNPPCCGSIRTSVSGESSGQPHLDHYVNQPHAHDCSQRLAERNLLGIRSAESDGHKDHVPKREQIKHRQQRQQPFWRIVGKKRSSVGRHQMLQIHRG